MQVRHEKPEDVNGIRAVNLAAFDTSLEANLVEALRRNAEPFVSLVAEDGGVIVGHIAFSPATLDGHPDVHVMGLAPMAVLPERQRQGIGSALVRAGVTRCEELGAAAVIVLGHAAYYPRFGFAPASRFGIRSEYDVPDDVFMVLPLSVNLLTGKTGLIRYHPVFHSV